MDNSKSIDEIMSEKVEEFCAITDTQSRIDFSVRTASQFHKRKVIGEAWRSVRDILEHPLMWGDDYHFSKVEDTLGAKIAVALYKFYLNVHEKNGVAPEYLKSSNDIVAYIDQLRLTEAEFAALYSLQTRVSRTLPAS